MGFLGTIIGYDMNVHSMELSHEGVHTITHRQFSYLSYSVILG